MLNSFIFNTWKIKSFKKKIILLQHVMNNNTWYLLRTYNIAATDLTYPHNHLSKPALILLTFFFFNPWVNFRTETLNKLPKLSQLRSRDTGSQIQVNGVQSWAFNIILYQEGTKGTGRTCKIFPPNHDFWLHPYQNVFYWFQCVYRCKQKCVFVNHVQERSLLSCSKCWYIALQLPGY